MNERDRRTSVRTPANFYASLSWDTGYASCEAVDLSRGGIRLKRPEPAPKIGWTVFVEFELPEEDRTIEAHGRVVYLDPEALGIAFDNLEESEAQHLLDYVHANGWLL